MPKPKSHEDQTQWSFLLPTELTAKVDLLLLDPMTGRVKYGSRKKLVEKLLREWLNKRVGSGAGDPSAGDHASH